MGTMARENSSFFVLPAPDSPAPISLSPRRATSARDPTPVSKQVCKKVKVPRYFESMSLRDVAARLALIHTHSQKQRRSGERSFRAACDPCCAEAPLFSQPVLPRGKFLSSRLLCCFAVKALPNNPSALTMRILSPCKTWAGRPHAVPCFKIANQLRTVADRLFPAPLNGCGTKGNWK
jgi:hypothetical protein